MPSIVSPMIKLETLARWAIATDESTSKSAASSNNPSPNARNK